MYITYDEYTETFGMIDELIFRNLSFEACRVMDIHTTGIDNVKKLQRFFPTDEYHAAAVRYCAGKLISLLDQIREAETAAAAARGLETTEQGMRGKVISSVSAGNESITYTTGAASTDVDMAVKDRKFRSMLIAQTVSDCLQGTEDANGVNLLYMGRYPRRYLC